MARPRRFGDRDAWRAWLAANGAERDEQWVLFFKKHTGRQGLGYDEAVEEAICFGWIDGVVRSRDEQSYMQRFTPRRQGGSWSESNLKRAGAMIDAGRMTPAGLERLGDALERYERNGIAHTAPRADTLPDELQAMLRANARAWQGFERLPPSHRREYLGWVLEAKRDETRVRRVKELVAVLAAGKKLGMK
jgi:uncharacterized protein YdeI (YjbR/CyaY-like superfamily)